MGVIGFCYSKVKSDCTPTQVDLITAQEAKKQLAIAREKAIQENNSARTALLDDWTAKSFILANNKIDELVKFNISIKIRQAKFKAIVDVPLPTGALKVVSISDQEIHPLIERITFLLTQGQYAFNLKWELFRKNNSHDLLTYELINTETGTLKAIPVDTLRLDIDFDLS